MPNPIYDPNMKGVLFDQNPDQKEKWNFDPNNKRPDWTGSCLIDNVDYNIAAWPTVAKKSGQPYYRLKLERKGEGKLSRTGEPQRQPVKQPQQPVLTEDNWDRFDDTPF